MNLHRTATSAAAITALLLAAGTAAAQPDNAHVQRGRPAGPAVKASSPVTLNFVNADIEAVTRAIGVMLNRQIIIDPRVKGTITVYSEQPVSVADAYRNYLAALRGLGFTVVESAGFLKVLPEPDAKVQAGSVAVESSNIRGDQIITQIFRIQHENANNLVATLRPLISPNNTINANPGNNSLVITDYADNLQRIAKIIAAMDTPGTSDIEIVPLKHAVAADLAPLVQRLADGGTPAGAAVPGQSSSTVNVLVDPRANGLILRASNPARLAAVRAMVDKLDQPSSDGGNSIRVVYLKNADAVKLATVLRAAFGAAASANSNSGGSSASGTGSLLSAGTNNNTNQTLTGSTSSTGTNSGGMNSTAATSPLSQSAGPSTGGFVQADPSTNSLIITAPEPLYRQVRAVIEQLDARRAQVYVESLIVKIDNTKAAQFGVQWQSLFGSKGDATIPGAGTNFGTGLSNIINATGAVANGTSGVTSALSSAAAPTGLNIGLLKKFGSIYTLGAVANFFESQSGANVLSTPNLVSLDNEEARIVIGQNVPFVTGSYASTSTSGTVNPFTTVDRKDVGLTLKVKSQIGEGGTVRMVVYQENSSVVPGSSGTTGPTLDKSAIETSVVVDDGDVIVLGGLLKDEYTDGDDGVPGLSKIPVLGNLFTSKNRKRVKTNLMVFLRPVVMRTAESANQLSMDRYESIRAVQQGAQPQKNMLLPDTGAPVLPEAKDASPRKPLPQQ
ncbi:type II secretion system secretin GspD [Roseateles puraquae]|uniref:Type IV pilus biogenesis and competence protein PilQ n=1 Tax=Roseateles puraquae TaxID=431059 RepID=A0A254NE78_9BURK|nr:type II secretion system secretin GspD [Roseateles puraquae]MDG0854668.1 type II secretion system protein GspD [Roseateles puraquae]OWR06266.1 type II secretion system protein GspD [Roseateles puraquae]